MILAMQEWLWLAVTVALVIVGAIAFFAIREARRIEHQERHSSFDAEREWRQTSRKSL
jgi:cytochrome c-type biogenesis protein CcmH/NrfF